MSPATMRISGALIVIGAGLAAFWIWKSPEARYGSTPGNSPVVSGREKAELGRSTTLQGSAGEVPLTTVPGDASDSSAPIPRKPTLGLRPANARKSSDARELTPEELEKFAPEIERYQKAWSRHLSPLVHAPGHPEEGTYLDSVTLDEAVEAQLRYYEEVSPPGHLDRPYLHVEKRIPYEKIRDRQTTWDQSDLQSNRELYDWIIAQPEDPQALPGDYWLPADPSDKNATTRREFLRARLREREAAIFEEGAR